MRIDIRGRNVEVTDDMREQVTQRFKRLGEQVSPMTQVDVVLSEEQNPAIAEKYVAEATLHVKGVTLHAHEATPEMTHSIHEVAEDMRRQVKRHKEKQRKRSQTRRLVHQLKS